MGNNMPEETGAEISENQKLHQAGAEIEFPAIFGFVPWRHHVEIVTKCYVVVELKAVSFEPEFAGKLNFYVNAVNELMKSESDNPTIGLLICKDKDQTEVQWAFQGIETPMGVATYDNIRLQEIKSQLPSEEAIQKRLEQAEEEYILKLKEKNK